MVYHALDTVLEHESVGSIGLAAQGEGRVRGDENKQKWSFCRGGSWGVLCLLDLFLYGGEEEMVRPLGDGRKNVGYMDLRGGCGGRWGVGSAEVEDLGPEVQKGW